MSKNCQTKLLLMLAFIFILQYKFIAQVCFSQTTYSSTNNGYDIVSADFNGDGKVDLATASGATLSILLGTGTGSFFPFTNFATNGNAKSLTTADFNGDGKADIATANTNSNSISILLGTGTGSFLSAVNYSVISNPISIISADFNNDGNIDLATANNNSNNITILLGNGTGNYTSTSNYMAGNQPTSLISGDFNNDGLLDLGVTNTPNSVSILNGNGLGGFVISTSYTLSNANFPQDIIAVDFNSDTNLDLAIATNNNVNILLGSGLGTFSISTVFVSYTLSVALPTSIVAADFNNDAKMDFALNPVAVFLGNGTGSFLPQINPYVPPVMPKAITSADFNGDGYADIATSNIATNASVLLNFFVSVSGPTSTCQWNNTVLTATNISSNSNYTWQPGGYVGSTITVSPVFSTTYSVTATTIFNCSNTTTISVAVIPSPTVSASSSSNLLCSGQTATLTALINGATSFSWNAGQTTTTIQVTPTVTTVYTISALGTNGCSNSAVYSQSVSTCVGMVENSDYKINFVTYPNPTNGNFMIIFNTEGESKKQIQLTNILGEIVFKKELTNNETQLDITNFPNGIYLLKMYCGNGVSVNRLIKE